MRGNRRVKIVEIVRSAQFGGVETHVYDLLEHGVRAGYDMKLISLANVQPDKKFTRLDIEIITLSDKQWMSKSIINNIGRTLLNIYHLYKVLKKVQPDVVHLHGTRPVFNGSIAARACRVKCILSTVHNPMDLMSIKPDGKRNSLLHYVSQVIYSVGMMISDRVITVSESIRQEIELFVKKNKIASTVTGKITVIYPGVDLHNIKNKYCNIRDEFAINESTVVIGCVTRLDEPKKGIGVLLKAISILKSKGCDIKVMIAGDGSSKAYLEKLTQNLSLTSEVIFLGYCRNVHELYKNFDIFVLPSLYEGLGIVNLEAMAASLPIVATRVGGIPEIVRHHENGLLVSPNNEQELSEALYYLIENKSASVDMGKTGKKIVESLYNKNKLVNDVFEEYARIYDKRSMFLVA